jgi:hypothetical protein
MIAPMTRILLAAAAAFAVLSGCAHAPPSEATPKTATATPGAAHPGGMMAMCPMGVPGTQVAAADAANGETIAFTTTGQVAELRSRVHGMAKMHDQHHAGADAHAGMAGGGMMGSGHAMGAMALPPSRATVLDTETGASIILVPNDPADLARLQSAARLHVQQMQKEGCGMMGEVKGS